MYQLGKFKHEEAKVTDAIGMSEKSFEEMQEITLKCFVLCSSPSEIAEYLHENADYEQILLMATYFITDKKQELKNILE
jgi:hypothetical protein